MSENYDMNMARLEFLEEENKRLRGALKKIASREIYDGIEEELANRIYEAIEALEGTK